MANYNSYFPQTYSYTPYVYGATATPAPVTAQPTYTETQSNSINWVQGEAGAKSVNVPAGQTILLMDSETNTFYVKSADLSGFPLPMRTFEYTEVSAKTTSDASAPSTYVTKEELSEELKQFETKLKGGKSNGKFDI